MSTNFLVTNAALTNLACDTTNRNAPQRLVTMRLDSLPFGIPARIAAIDTRDQTARRLMEMGVVPGATIRVIKAAPLGCPLEIEVRGYRLAVRRSEAVHVSVIELSKS